MAIYTKVKNCRPLGQPPLARRKQAHSLESNHSHGAGRASRTERCKTFAPNSARPSHRAVQDLRTERDATLHSGECAYPTRASVPIPLERVCLSHSSECAYPTRASGCVPLERAGGLCTGEQGGFARASREAFPSLEGRCSPRPKGGVPLARRVAFLRGDLFIETKLKIIAYILGLIFTIQIYIGTLIFARRAYGVIL